MKKKVQLRRAYNEMHWLFYFGKQARATFVGNIWNSGVDAKHVEDPLADRMPYFRDLLSTCTESGYCHFPFVKETGITVRHTRATQEGTRGYLGLFCSSRSTQ